MPQRQKPSPLSITRYVVTVFESSQSWGWRLERLPPHHLMQTSDPRKDMDRLGGSTRVERNDGTCVDGRTIICVLRG